MMHNLLTTFIDRIDWTTLFQFSLGVGIVLVVFQMSTAEKLEACIPYTEAHHGAWGFLRRLTTLLKGLALVWLANYGHDHGWNPWPPVVALVISLNFYIFVRIMIMRQDIKAHRDGRRVVYYLGDHSEGLSK